MDVGSGKGQFSGDGSGKGEGEVLSDGRDLAKLCKKDKNSSYTKKMGFVS